MAYIHDEYCYVCKKVTPHVNDICVTCSEIHKQQEEERRRIRRATMTLEERIEEIERWIDNFKCPHDLKY